MLKGIRVASVIIILILLLSFIGFVSVLPDLIGISEEKAVPFEIDQALIKVLIKSGESLGRSIRIMNVGDNALNFNIETSDSISDILRISEKSFSLKPGQSKTIQVTFSSRLDTTEYLPDVYVGKINVQSDSFSKSIPVIVEIESQIVLFDTNINVQPQYRRVFQGNETIIEVKLFNLQGIEPTSVKMEYFIKDLDGNIIITESETVVVATQTVFTKTFRIPENLKPGTYVFSVNSIYGSSVGTSSYLFEIVEFRPGIINLINACLSNAICLFGIFILIIVALVLGTVIYIFSTFRPRVVREVKPKVVVKKIKRPSLSERFENWKRKRKLERQKRIRERQKQKRLRELQIKRERAKKERLRKLEEQKRRKEILKEKREEELERKRIEERIKREKLRKLKEREKARKLRRQKLIKLGLIKTRAQRLKELKEAELKIKRKEKEKRKRELEKLRKEEEEKVRRELEQKRMMWVERKKEEHIKLETERRMREKEKQLMKRLQRKERRLKKLPIMFKKPKKTRIEELESEMEKRKRAIEKLKEQVRKRIRRYL